VVTIDLITKLPRTMKQHDSIMVVVDKLKKVAHFIPVKIYIVEIYMKEFSRLHGVPKKIVSDKETKFTSNFWKCLFKEFGINLNLYTMYHSESHGKT
jgi:hypothetical protein